MPTERAQIRCPGCGVPKTFSRLGLDETTGAFNGQPHEPALVVFRYGGRASLTAAPAPLPMHVALGLRDALRAALARLEGEIAEAGGA